MKNNYNNYVSGVQTQIVEKEKHDFLKSAIPIISEFKLIAEKNKGDLKTFKGINNELCSSLERSLSDINQLSNLFSNSREVFNKLPVLKSKIKELDAHPISSDTLFNSKVKNLINNAYSQMSSSGIDSAKNTMQKLIKEMELFELNKQLEEEERLRQLEEEERLRQLGIDERNKQLLKIVLIGIGVIIGLYLVFAFVIPFIIAWWWVLLIIAIGIGWLMSNE